MKIILTQSEAHNLIIDGLMIKNGWNKFKGKITPLVIDNKPCFEVEVYEYDNQGSRIFFEPIKPSKMM